jgi:hypothetical protein
VFSTKSRSNTAKGVIHGNYGLSSFQIPDAKEQYLQYPESFVSFREAVNKALWLRITKAIKKGLAVRQILKSKQYGAQNVASFLCPNPLLAGGHPSMVFVIHSLVSRQLT